MLSLEYNAHDSFTWLSSEVVFQKIFVEKNKMIIE